MAMPVRAIFFPVICPLGTSAAESKRPLVSTGLIWLCVLGMILVFVWSGCLDTFGLTPGGRPYQLLTYPFFHANLTQCLLNLIVLWTFSRALEERLGPLKLLILFIVAGLAGGAAHSVLERASREPLAGLSAAVFGMIGAMIVLFPRDVVNLYVSVLFLISPVFVRVLRIPVLVFAGLYLLMEFGLVELDQMTDDSFFLAGSTFAAGAQVAGLVAGMILGFIYRALETDVIATAETGGALAAALAEIAMPAEPKKDYIFPVGPFADMLREPQPHPQPQTEPAEPRPTIEDLAEAIAAISPPGLKKPPQIKIIESPEVQTAKDSSAIRLPDDTSGIRMKSEKPVGVSHEAPGVPMPSIGGGACHVEDGNAGDDHEKPAGRQPSDYYEMKAAVADESSEVELNLESSEDTAEQARALKDDSAWPESDCGRYSLILGPGRPKNLNGIVELLGKTLNLSPKGAYYNLLHRHGILTENVTWAEAVKTAEAFKKLGHPVQVAALTSRVEFGEALDILSCNEQDDYVQFRTAADLIQSAWSQIVFLAAGQVTITPGAPPRRAIDLFMIQPRHHLRLWDNALEYSFDAPKFRPLAERIARKSFRAIHTRSLDKWLHNTNEPLNHFAGMIEYNHYLTWHLLAHLAPTKIL